MFCSNNKTTLGMVFFFFLYFLGNIFLFHPNSKTYKTDFLFHGITWYVIWPSIFLVSLSKNMFYSEADKEFLDKRVIVGIPATDTFFITKINSEISSIKKSFGYVYVISKVVAFGGIGYILAIDYI
jgi:hypothetical protein